MRKGIPVGACATDSDVAHRFIMDDLMPEKLKSEIEFSKIGRVTIEVPV